MIFGTLILLGSYVPRVSYSGLAIAEEGRPSISMDRRLTEESDATRWMSEQRPHQPTRSKGLAQILQVHQEQ